MSLNNYTYPPYQTTICSKWHTKISWSWLLCSWPLIFEICTTSFDFATPLWATSTISLLFVIIWLVSWVTLVNFTEIFVAFPPVIVALSAAAEVVVGLLIVAPTHSLVIVALWEIFEVVVGLLVVSQTLLPLHFALSATAENSLTH